jgi:transposase
MAREVLDSLAAQRRETESLRVRLDQLLRQLYGPKSEWVAGTPSLFEIGPSDNASSLTPPPDPESDGYPDPRRCRHGLRRLPREFPRQWVERDIAEAQKLCPCCHAPRVRIGEDVTERVDYRPASL